MDCVEVILYAVDVCVAGVVDYQDIIDVSEVPNNLMLVWEVCEVGVLYILKKNSAIMLEVGASMASPSGWISILSLLEK